MCLEKFSTTEFRTPCMTFTGKEVLQVLKTFSDIIKAVAARCLYGVYMLLAVWRVTVALQEPLYWLLLFTTVLIALETIHTIIARKGGELKWVTPSVFFYLMCAVPCIWLLELKLLRDRLQEQNDGTSAANSTSSTSNVININLSDAGWTLALEQILIFVLVFSKWIAPKGELSRDQLSQLLLVYLGAGADIIELLESFNEDEVSLNADLVYLVMAVWSWSLIQFCIVPTAFKELPDVDEPMDPEIGHSAVCSTTTEVTEIMDQPGNSNENGGNQEPINSHRANNNGKETQPLAKKMRKPVRSKSEGVAQAIQNGAHPKARNLPKNASVGSSLAHRSTWANKVGNMTIPEQNSQQTFENSSNNQTQNDEMSRTAEYGRTQEGTARILSHTCGKKGYVVENNSQKVDQIAAAKKDPWDHAIIVIHDEDDDLKLEDKITSILSGRKCGMCFCFYTEIWGMVMSMLFQDFPFLITRLFIMFHYNVVSHMTIFFTFKNIVIILLLLNRIRVVVLEERGAWQEHMNEVNAVRKRNEEILREQRRRGMNSQQKTKLPDTNPDQPELDEYEESNESVNPPTRNQIKMKKPKWLFWRS